jgi:hypothetical protein
MSFLQQYDRLFLLTMGLVAVIRGLGGLAAVGAAVLAPSVSAAASGGAQVGPLGLLALLHSVVLLISGTGLLLRRPSVGSCPWRSTPTSWPSSQAHC